MSELNGDYKIETGVPIPEGRGPGRPRHGLTEALRQLKVGQSVFKKDGNASSLGGQMFLARAGTSKKFVARNIKDGARVWRIA